MPRIPTAGMPPHRAWRSPGLEAISPCPHLVCGTTTRLATRSAASRRPRRYALAGPVMGIPSPPPRGNRTNASRDTQTQNHPAGQSADPAGPVAPAAAPVRRKAARQAGPVQPYYPSGASAGSSQAPSPGGQALAVPSTRTSGSGGASRSTPARGKPAVQGPASRPAISDKQQQQQQQQQQQPWRPQGPDLPRSPSGGGGDGTGGKAGWQPRGPDAAPTAQESTQHPTATAAAAAVPASSPPSAKHATKGWLSSWGAASASGSPRRSAASNPGSPAGSESAVSRAARNLKLLQGWGSDAGARDRGRAAGGARDGRGPAGGPSKALSTLMTAGPRVERAPDGRWLLQGCDAEFAQLPANVAALTARLSAAISAEQAAEREALAALYARTSIRKLQRDGVVLAGLRARRDGELYRAVIWRFTLPGGESPPAGNGSPAAALPYHKFRQGDGVLVSRVTAEELQATDQAPKRRCVGGDDDWGPDGTAWFVEGTVLEARRTHLLVTLDRMDSDRFEKQGALWAGAAEAAGASRRRGGGGARVLWRLDASVRDVTAVRQREALSRLGQWTEGGGTINSSGAPPVAGEALVRLSLTMSNATVPVLAAQPPVWVRDPLWREAARRLLAAQDNLNDSQRRAVARAMVSSLTLWQGPPGTGKTRTLLALVRVLVASSRTTPGAWQAMGPVLACGDTNAAVDNLVEGLQSDQLLVVRIGNPAKVRPSLRHLTLEALAEARTEAGREAARIRRAAEEKLEACRQAVERAQAAGDAARGDDALWTTEAFAESAARADLARADALLKAGMEQVLAAAQVVCATCAGAGDQLLAAQMFRAVVIDEASQATEPATLVPLTKGAQCVVMAGDPRQLPPTVTSREAVLQHQLDVTLFDRLSAAGVAPMLLDTQYRMHPGVAAFPAAHFYGGRLRDGVTAADKPPPTALPWPDATRPVMFVQVEGREERTSVATAPGAAELASPQEQAGRGPRARADSSAPGSGGSYRNQAEAVAAMQVLQLVLRDPGVGSVALLAPYKGQVRLLEGMLRRAPPGLGARLEVGGTDVTVSSVDGFQGREADVVIFCAVRCNRHGGIGFVADARRLNVAITRPRRGLVVIGSDATLSAGSPDWRAYVAWAGTKGVLLNASALLGPGWEVQGAAAFAPADSMTSEDSGDEERPGRPSRAKARDSRQGSRRSGRGTKGQAG